MVQDTGSWVRCGEERRRRGRMDDVGGVNRRQESRGLGHETSLGLCPFQLERGLRGHIKPAVSAARDILNTIHSTRSYEQSRPDLMEQGQMDS